MWTHICKSTGEAELDTKNAMRATQSRIDRLGGFEADEPASAAAAVLESCAEPPGEPLRAASAASAASAPADRELAEPEFGTTLAPSAAFTSSGLMPDRPATPG